jgi:Arc/MetJ-type ribon-helix-helix transcriptional regulator
MTRKGHLNDYKIKGMQLKNNMIMAKKSHLSVICFTNIGKLRKPIHLSIPAELYDIIDKTVVKDGLYRSVPEFIFECTRNRLFDLRKQKIDRQKLNIYFKKLKQRREKVPI